MKITCLNRPAGEEVSVEDAISIDYRGKFVIQRTDDRWEIICGPAGEGGRKYYHDQYAKVSRKDVRGGASFSISDGVVIISFSSEALGPVLKDQLAEVVSAFTKHFGLLVNYEALEVWDEEKRMKLWGADFPNILDSYVESVAKKG